MADSFGPTFGGYIPMVGPITQAVQDEIIAEVNKLKALIPDITADPAVRGVSPDFDKIHPQTAEQLRKELDELIVQIDATPIA